MSRSQRSKFNLLVILTTWTLMLYCLGLFDELFCRQIESDLCFGGIYKHTLPRKIHKVILAKRLNKINVLGDSLCLSVAGGNFNAFEYARYPDLTGDKEVLVLAQSGCKHLLNHYSFPIAKNTSKVERENPIAFSLLVHKNLNQVFKLLSAIYTTQNSYCIHVDLKSKKGYYQALEIASHCLPNVFLSSERESVVYKGFSRLQADINCMKDLLNLEATYKWKYLINLCGQDFPLKTNLEMVNELIKLDGRNVIIGLRSLDKATLRRTTFVHVLEKKKFKHGKETTSLVRTTKLKSPPPYNISLKKNLAYNIFSRSFLSWALFESKKSKALLEWSRDTLSPDEHYWLMIASLDGAPGGLDKSAVLPRYVVFKGKGRKCRGYWKHYSCVFGGRDLPIVGQQMAFFANKFDITFDALPVACLRKDLDSKRKELLVV